MRGVIDRCRWSSTAREPIAEPLRESVAAGDRAWSDRAGEDAALFRSLIAQYHYLGVRSAAGENLKYLVRDRRWTLAGLPVVCGRGVAVQGARSVHRMG